MRVSLLKRWHWVLIAVAFIDRFGRRPLLLATRLHYTVAVEHGRTG